MIVSRHGRGRALRWLVVVLCTLCPACGGGEAEPATTAAPSSAGAATTSIPDVSARRLRLGLVVHADAPEHTLHFWPTVLLGALEAAEDHDVDLEIRGDFDSAVQARIVDTLIADGVDGLIVSLPDLHALKPALDRAASAGIPVITINSGIEHYLETTALTHVGQFDSAAGRLVGDRLTTMRVRGDVLCVILEADNVALEERCDGVEETYPNGTVVRLRMQWELVDLASMISAISRELEGGEFAAVVSLDLAAGSAAADAVRAAQTDTVLTTFDVVPEALEAIRSGELALTVDQQPYLQGSLPVQLLVDYLRDGSVPDRTQPVETGPRLVDSTNVDEVAAESARMAARIAARFGS